MPSTSLSSLLIIGKDIMGTQLNPKGSVSAQIGDSITGDVDSNDCSFWQHVGFASRPASAESGKSSAQCLGFEQGDKDIIFASRDIRGQAIYGNLKPGETALYAAGPNNEVTTRVFLKDDGSIATLSLLTQEGNTSSGNPVIIQLSSENKINIANGDKGAIAFDTNGISIATTGTLNMGSQGAMALIGSTLALNAAGVTLGAAASEPVMGSVALLAWVGQVNAALAAISAAAGQTVNPTITPPVAAPLASTSVKMAM
jgi:ethanolamine utilization microcompartment shell protein EutS